MKSLKSIGLYVFGSMLLAPALAFAQNQPAATAAGEEGARSATLNNPLKGSSDDPITNIGALFDEILGEVIIPVSIALGIVFIIWAGFNFILAQGKPEELKKARSRFFATIIGVVIIISAQILLDILLATITEITNVP